LERIAAIHPSYLCDDGPIVVAVRMTITKIQSTRLIGDSWQQSTHGIHSVRENVKTSFIASSASLTCPRPMPKNRIELCNYRPQLGEDLQNAIDFEFNVMK
jgi:hypothetical protein